MRTTADSLEWIGFRLLALGCEFRVEEPAELVDHLRRLGERISRATETGAGRE